MGGAGVTGIVVASRRRDLLEVRRVTVRQPGRAGMASSAVAGGMTTSGTESVVAPARPQYSPALAGFL
jgi:hypothetical protein